MWLRKILLSLTMTVVSLCGLMSCASEPNSQEMFKHLKGKPISVIAKQIKRPADFTEDWLDYKRYTWQMCRTTGDSQIVQKDDGSYYLKSTLNCCAVVFETNIDNRIIGFSDLKACPVYMSLSYSPNS